MTASPTAPARRRGRLGWLAGVLTLVLLAGFGVLLGAPSTAATLPETAASTFVPADATRGSVTLRLGDTGATAELSDARLAARAVPGVVSPTAYATVAPEVRAGSDVAWFREAVVPVDPSLPARYRYRAVDARGVWLVVQDWDEAGFTFDGLLELPADVAVGRTWTSTGTARARATAGTSTFRRTSTASTPDDEARAAAGCLTVASRTALTGPRDQVWTESTLWCPGKGAVAGTGTVDGRAYAVTSGGTPEPVSDADLAETPWDPTGVAGWRLQTRPLLAGDPTFGLVDASGTAVVDPARAPVVTDDGLVTFPTFEGGDLAGLVPRGPALWAHWWARPGGQVTSLATVGSLVVAPTTAHRVSAYRAGRTLAWNASLDDVAVAPPLPIDGAVVVASVSGELTSLDARTGTARWTTAVGGGVHTPLAAGDGVVVTADTGSRVTAWDLATGAQRWHVDDAANPWATTLAVADGEVVVAGGGTLTAYGVADGRRRWVREAGLGLTSVTVVGDALWLGVGKDLQAWALTDGRLRWSMPGAQPLTTAASRCEAPPGSSLGLARGEGRLLAVGADGTTRGSWSLPVADHDTLTATCRAAGVDLTAYAPDGSRPLTVLRLAVP